VSVLETIWGIIAHVYSNDALFREFMNGAWWWIGVFMVSTTFWRLTVLIRYLWSDIGRRSFLFERVRMLLSAVYASPNILILMAVACYLTGSIGRSGWIWVYLNCQNVSDFCKDIQESYWYLTIASILAVGGGMCYVRIVLHRWWMWIGAGAVSVSAPALVAYNDISLIGILRSLWPG
jgi:hypothetical protein